MKTIRGFLLGILVALAAPGYAVAQATAFVGDWLILKSIDPFTDDNDSTMGAIPSDYPTLGSNDLLAFGCKPSGQNGIVLALMGSNYVSENTVVVTYRVDTNPPVTDIWRKLNTDVVGPLPGAETQALIDAMLDGSKIAIRYSAYSTTATYIYPISGLREALRELGCYTGTL